MIRKKNLPKSANNKTVTTYFLMFYLLYMKFNLYQFILKIIFFVEFNFQKFAFIYYSNKPFYPKKKIFRFLFSQF